MTRAALTRSTETTSLQRSWRVYLLVVNNWLEIADAADLINGSSSRIFFVTFWVLGVIVMLNIFALMFNVVDKTSAEQTSVLQLLRHLFDRRASASATPDGSIHSLQNGEY